MQHPLEENNLPTPAAQTAQADAASKLEQRKKALAAAFGILKGKGVFPEDGLEYQLKLRTEWN